jgi:alpha-beta hydrolase superfamily lysophospholipase
MGLMVEQGGAFEEYEAVALPPGPGSAGRSLGSAVFLRRSARPSRRAVLHLHDLSGSFAPADLARWYNERGFHFYVTDLDMREPLDGAGRRKAQRSLRACFAALDAACQHLRQADGIDAIILSAADNAAPPAALWCHARRAARPADALILSNPDFGKGFRGRLDISCPVLVIAASGPQGRRSAGRTGTRSPGGGVRLGQHVTWLSLDQAHAADGTAARKRLFDEMGRWLGAYMYGQVRDQLL